MRALVRDRQATSVGVASVLETLCQVTVEELDLLGAVVSLMTVSETGRGQSGAIAAASNAEARIIEELEFSL